MTNHTEHNQHFAYSLSELTRGLIKQGVLPMYPAHVNLSASLGIMKRYTRHSLPDTLTLWEQDVPNIALLLYFMCRNDFSLALTLNSQPNLDIQARRILRISARNRSHQLENQLEVAKPSALKDSLRSEIRKLKGFRRMLNEKATPTPHRARK